MNKHYITLFIATCLANFSWAQNTRVPSLQDSSPVKIRIATFRDDKACAISYTFDDGLKEHATLVNPRLNKLGFKGTFVINGSKINEDANNIKDTTRMTWQDLKIMAKAGQEISNHGWAHKNHGKFPLAEIKEDILKNDSAIYANIGIMPRTYAYPNNTKRDSGVAFASLNRVGTRTFQRSLGGHSNAQELEEWVNKLLNNHDWGVTMTHGITYGYDFFKSPAVLWDHLDKVKSMEEKIWVGTFHDVAAYVKERDSTTITINSLQKGGFKVTPECRLDKKLFNQPLTAVIELKKAKQYQFRQRGNQLKARVQDDVVLFDFDPFGGDIEILRKK